MSNLYATEPTPNAKVIVDTTAGEIELELWGKEAPKAVRNFLALSMEGYYEGVIFHRVVKDFIVQTGDPTGTGMGGESYYGESFEDEIHPRLRFNRRGLLGMANNGKRHTNNSQWFITLDRADELTSKHTVFGRVSGPTIYNVLNIGNLDVDAQEKPLVPPKIRGVRIVENPFEDIVPRITAAEKQAQQKARLEAKRDLELREKRAKAKKNRNTKLLSFGEAEEVEEDQVTVKKKDLVRQDLVGSAESSKKPKAAVEQYVEVPESIRHIGSSREKDKRKVVDLKEIRAEHERMLKGDSASRKAEIDRIQENLRKLKKQTGEGSDSDSDTSSTRRKRRKGASYLEQELAKYSRGRGRAARVGSKKGRKDDDDDLLKEMSRFSKRILSADNALAPELPREMEADDEEDQGPVPSAFEQGLEVDDDVDWMKHSLRFAVSKSDETRRAEEDYTVIDPRAKAREVMEQEKRDKESSRKAR